MNIYRKTDCFRLYHKSIGYGFVSCHVYGYGKGKDPIDGDKNAASCAAERGHFECLQYIHEKKNGYWDEITVIAAAGGNHLVCLRYLLNENCPWSKNVCSKLLNDCEIWIPKDKTMTASACEQCQKTL